MANDNERLSYQTFHRTIKEETRVADLLSEPPVFSGNFAFFFDLDGTLADIKPHPDQVFVPPDVLKRLARLAEMNDGAVALISGRSMAELDACQSYRFPCRGSWGRASRYQRSNSPGDVARRDSPAAGTGTDYGNGRT
jgi:trehalose-6-phosphatase